jgi:hypothetical protein
MSTGAFLAALVLLVVLLAIHCVWLIVRVNRRMRQLEREHEERRRLVRESIERGVRTKRP